MNPKVTKLKEELAKNKKRITSLQARNKKIEEDIVSLENTDIIGMVREHELTPDQLYELIRNLKKDPASVLKNTDKTEESKLEE